MIQSVDSEMSETAALSTALWPVVVFAHNEAENIVACLDSLTTQKHAEKLSTYVLANGCSDLTEDVVQKYIVCHPNVRLHSIELGDKSNAWNIFVHELSPPSEVYFFIDGDVKACENALAELYLALMAHSEANAAAALPVMGRNCLSTRKIMIENSELAGNLYGLSGKFVQRIKAMNVKMPVGFIGEDGLVGALAKWNLDPQGPWDNTRIVPCDTVGFSFKPLSWRRWSNWRLYWNRLIRYRVRAFEFKLLGPRLKSEGLGGMPAHVTDLFRDGIDRCRLRWNGVDTFFDWLALRRIKRYLT